MLISLHVNELGLSIKNSEIFKNDSDASYESLTVTRVEPFCEKRDSSRGESLFFSTWLDSCPSHLKSWLLSRRVIDSIHAIIARNIVQVRSFWQSEMSGQWNFSVRLQSWSDKIESEPILIRKISENHQLDPVLIRPCKKNEFLFCLMMFSVIYHKHLIP